MHDQQALMYDRYQVVGCKVEIQYSNAGNSLIRVWHVPQNEDEFNEAPLFVDPAACTTAELQRNMERGYPRQKMLLLGTATRDNPYAKARKYFKAYYSLRRLLTADGFENSITDFGSQPAIGDRAQLLIYLNHETLTDSEQLLLSMYLRITYYVRLSSPKNIAIS